MTESLTPVGIDVSKLTLDVSVCWQGKWIHTKVSNTAEGYESLQRWMQKRKLGSIHACLEATGTYSDGIALFLFEHGSAVSVINPARMAAFRQSEGIRTKTDRQDAKLLVRYCHQKQPALWKPTAQQVQQLQVLLLRQEQLHKMKQQEQNHLENGRLDPLTREQIQTHLQQIEAQLSEIEQRSVSLVETQDDLQERCDLLTSIPGIGALTARRLMGVIAEIERFESASQLVAYAGLAPVEKSSGTSVRGKGGISKTGQIWLRKWLYMSGMRVKSCSKEFEQWEQQLKARGKTGKVIVVAMMRKLLHVIYGVWKSGRPYDASKAFPAYSAPAVLGAVPSVSGR